MNAKSKHILLITHEYPPYPGGVGRYCASLAAAAVRLGHRVTVLAPDHGNTQAVAQISDGVQVKRFAGNLFHFRQMNSFAEEIKKTLAGDTYDEIHAADWPALIAVGKIKPPQRCVATLHGTDIRLIKRSIRARLAFAGHALKHFAHFYCNSQYTQNLFRTHFPKLAVRSTVTFLGVDGSWFESAKTSAVAAFKSRIHFHEGDRVILTVARLDGRKGQLTTIEALASLTTEVRKSICYVCVGKEVEQGYGERLKSAATNAGVRLVLTGRIPDDELHAAYASADVFALTGIEHPINVEGFGLVLLEAAAQGLPAVVTNVQAIPEVVEQGLTGWVAQSTKALPQCFTDALMAGRATLRSACIDRARQYTWDRCALQTYGATLK